MAAGGMAAAIRAAKLKAQPRKTYYGGSADAYNNIAGGYADQVDASGNRVGGGVGGLQQAGATGQQISQRGFGLMDRAFSAPASGTGVNALSQMDPRAVAAAQAQQAIDANSAANLGAARAGGALAMRNAVAANAAAGVQAAGAAGVAGMQGRQQQLAMIAQAQQANAARDQQQQLGLLSAGGQLATAGNGQAAGAAGSVANVGLGQQQLFQGALQNTQDNQFQADMNYEQRRQQEQQRRSNNIWNFAGGLVGAGGAIAGSAMNYGGGK